MKLNLLKSIGIIGAVIAGNIAFADLPSKIPTDVKWITNDTAATFASPEAKKGGTYRSYMTEFPLTLRYVGPDSNSGMAGYVRACYLGLLDLNPNNPYELIPQLATHWAFGKDHKTMYFKLDKNAKWSDGKPVTADDYLFTLEFMRSKHIVDPWYNDYYSEIITGVVKYDDYTIGVSGKVPKSDYELFNNLGFSPFPKHFYVQNGFGPEYVKKFNWLISPCTSAYVIDKFDKGKYISLKRVKNWWGENNKYFKNRFNVDEIRLDVVRDDNVAWEKFLKGDLDTYPITMPTRWYDKAKGPQFDKGYIKKVWYYNETPQGPVGFWLNLDKEIWKDKNLRYAFAHAVDMDGMIKKILRGDYDRLHAFYTGNGEYMNKKVRAREFSIAKTKEFMEKSGWKRGKDGIYVKDNQRFSFTVTYGTPPHTDRLTYIKEEAKKAGVEINLQLMDSASAFKTAMEKKVDVYWGGYSTGMIPEPKQYFHSENAHIPQTNNIMNIADPEMDKLIDGYRNSVDDKASQDYARKIQDKLQDIGSFVPAYAVPYVRESYWRYWKLPKGFGTKSSSVLFDDVGSTYGGLFWLDDAALKETKEALKSGKTYPPETIIDKTYKN